jgi:hypothetical protein
MATNFYTQLNLNGNEVVGLPATPAGATSAVSKAYVDSVATGLDVKDSVVTASAAPVVLNGVGATVGGVAVALNNRVLVKDQATASQNGIYVVRAEDWTRSADATVGTGATLTLGAFTFVEGGTNQGKGYVYSATNTWSQFSDTGALGAGDGITIASGSIAVKAKTDGNITVTGDGVSVSGTLPVTVGGTGATTLTGYVKGNGTSAMTAATSIPAIDVIGRRLVTSALTIATGAVATVVDTTALNSTLRGNATVQLFDGSGNQVFADVTVGADAVTINTVNNTGSAITIKAVISV